MDCRSVLRPHRRASGFLDDARNQGPAPIVRAGTLAGADSLPTYPRRDASMAEPTVQSDREDAQQEEEVHPHGRGAPIDWARIASGADEFRGRERRVTAAQRPDPEEVVLPDPMERREADPDEPGPDRPSRQGRQEPRPHPPDDGRSREETHPEREHRAA